MKEKQIEQALVQAVRDRGGICPKWISPGLDGVPDRIILFPGGKIAFCETKAPGQKPRPLQTCRAEQLRGLGFRVYMIDQKERIGEIIDEICTT